jgi:hypothetical protein
MALTVNANIGDLSMKEAPVLFGNGPHVVRTPKLLAGQEALDPGRVVALDAASEVVPYDAAQTIDGGTGDGSETTFTGSLGPIEPGNLSIADGVETFTDDGFGNLAGDAAGTGKVNYKTGAFSVTFNTAPILDATVAVTYKPIMHGVLTKKAEADAGICEVCIGGKVVLSALKIGSVAPTAAQVLKLDRLGIWAV